MAAFVHQPITMPSRAPTTVETPRRTLAFARNADMTTFCKEARQRQRFQMQAQGTTVRVHSERGIRSVSREMPAWSVGGIEG
jgi:hypothetical protein